MRLRTKTLVLALFTFAVVACGDPPNHLEGSISSNVSLDFDRTRLIRYASLSMQLEYLKALEGGGGDDVVAKLVFDTPEGGVKNGEPIDLVAEDGVVERIVAEGDAFPPMDTGQLTFDLGGNEPGPAQGSFAVTFDNGRTLNGNFDVELEDVDL